MNRGTHEGDLAEIKFVKEFNSNKNNENFDFYIKDCNIDFIDDVYMVRVTTKQFSKLSKQKVMTRADTYLISSKDELIKEILFENNNYLDENLLFDNNIKFDSIDYSGISIKLNDSNKFQILKLTPESFNTLFREYEIGAGASIYCLREEEIEKNKSVFLGWNTSKEKVISKYENNLPDLKLLNNKISIIDEMKIYKELKDFSNFEIKKRIDDSKYLKEIIFNGYHIYEEPYSASYFYKGNKITKLEYIPFCITTGSGRSKGNYTIVLKPKNEANQ